MPGDVCPRLSLVSSADPVFYFHWTFPTESRSCFSHQHFQVNICFAVQLTANLSFAFGKGHLSCFAFHATVFPEYLRSSVCLCRPLFQVWACDQCLAHSSEAGRLVLGSAFVGFMDSVRHEYISRMILENDQRENKLGWLVGRSCFR